MGAGTGTVGRCLVDGQSGWDDGGEGVGGEPHRHRGAWPHRGSSERTLVGAPTVGLTNWVPEASKERQRKAPNLG